MTTTLQASLTRLDALKVFPAVAVRVREVANDPRSTLQDLERVVAMDPALTARILKIANSPAFGMAAQVSALKPALLLLGFDATRDLAFALALGGMSERRGPPGKKLWQHSLAVAMLSRSFAVEAGGVDAQRAFVAGLLHELGMILLMELLPEQYPTIVASAGQDPQALLERERATLGFDHAALGGAAMRRFGLPADLCDVVEGHHAPSGTRIGQVVGLADHIGYLLGTGHSRAAVLAAGVADEAAVALGLDERRVFAAIERVVGQARHVTREVA